MSDRTLPRVEEELASTPVLLHDDVLNPLQHADVERFLQTGGWEFGWKSSSKRGRYSFWHKHFAGYRNGHKQTEYDCEAELMGTAPLIWSLWRALAATTLEGHTLIRCYANAHAFGGEGTWHTDSRKPDRYTSIYYPLLTWHPDWGGETVLFNDDKSDIIFSIYPRPNRLAMFKGTIPHVARGLARTCPVLRITLMFKTAVGPLSEETDD